MLFERHKPESEIEPPESEAAYLRSMADCAPKAEKCGVSKEFAYCVEGETGAVLWSADQSLEAPIAGGSRGDVTVSEDGKSCDWKAANGGTITAPKL